MLNLKEIYFLGTEKNLDEHYYDRWLAIVANSQGIECNNVIEVSVNERLGKGNELQKINFGKLVEPNLKQVLQHV